MCRFVAYISHHPMVLSALLERPEHSLIEQSHAAREGRHGLNADGFGLAWYAPNLNPNPGLFKSTQPAWNDPNLHHIATKIASPCFLAHVRASTVGDVHPNNCHPFSFGPYAFVHNGTIRHFETLKRALLATLDDKHFHAIAGNTDSEHFFFLVMQYLQTTQQLDLALCQAIAWVINQQQHLDDDHFSRLNTVITDGHTLIASRVASKHQSSLSLYYAQHANQNHPGWIISSEPLDEHIHRWHEIPENHWLKVEATSLEPTVEAMPI